jgi:hypothetical protein
MFVDQIMSSVPFGNLEAKLNPAATWGGSDGVADEERDWDFELHPRSDQRAVP